MYPFSHNAIAKEMCTSGGGLVTEFPSKTLPDRVNFPRRNRIVAGMVDGLVIIESKAKGGSMITSELAFDYNRDVFAFPGSVNQENSRGCNVLIQKNMAHLVTHASDILKLMNWCKSSMSDNPNIINQKSVHVSLIDPKEIRIVDLLKQKGKTHVDQMIVDLNSSVSELNALLFSMEMEGIVKSYPGKQYSL
jgi:DNA processing protein